MARANREGKRVPPEIWTQVWETLEQISDEAGEEKLGNGYILKYEGWGGACVEDAWLTVEAEQKKRGIDTESAEAEGEREAACCAYAEEQSYTIADHEWKPALRRRGYRFIDGGQEPGGLYGRTWALFKNARRDTPAPRGPRTR